MTCVDVGCGGGDVTLQLAALIGPQGRVVGLDMDETKLEMARQAANQLRLANVQFRRMNMENWIEVAQYDCIYCRFLLTRCHFAFAVSFEQLVSALEKLNERGIETRGFGGEPYREPSVIGWMPSAQIYFRDPDGHSLEFITILPDAPSPGFNGSYTEWKELIGRQESLCS